MAWEFLPTVVRQETTFDKNSLLFIEPVDMSTVAVTPEGTIYEPTDKYDKYLVFPKTNILGKRVPGPAGAVVPWTNNSDQTVNWTNNSSNDVQWRSSV